VNGLLLKNKKDAAPALLLNKERVHSAESKKKKTAQWVETMILLHETKQADAGTRSPGGPMGRLGPSTTQTEFFYFFIFFHL